MDKGVRKIFFTLIGTVVLIVFISFFTELINISLYGIQLQQITRMACDKSLTLFTQETYKQRQDEESLLSGGSINMSDVSDADGDFYVTGTFYPGDSVESIYNSLYSSSVKSDFSDWVAVRESDGNWASINLLNQYLNGSFPITTMPVFDTYMNSYSDSDTAYEKYEEDMAKYSEYSVAKSYVDTYMTPLNFGVPYIDMDTVNTMFRWNLTQLFSNCNPELIRKDEAGEACIEISGFRVYASRAQITNIDYTVYDLNDTNERARFTELTHVDPNNLGFTTDLTYLGTNDDERQRICVLGVEYSVPISYIGITPIRNIFNYVWNTEVEGWEGKSQRSSTAQQFQYSTLDMTGGGYDGNTSLSGVLPVPGKVIFYVVR